MDIERSQEVRVVPHFEESKTAIRTTEHEIFSTTDLQEVSKDKLRQRTRRFTLGGIIFAINSTSGMVGIINIIEGISQKDYAHLNEGGVIVLGSVPGIILALGAIKRGRIAKKEYILLEKERQL